MNTFSDFLADLKMFGLLVPCLLAIALLTVILIGGSALVNVICDAIKGALTW